ncbi:MAG: energy-coupling factor ABC transporter ATP-binding protein [Sedimentisphaeraceae bacterium JB056]
MEKAISIKDFSYVYPDKSVALEGVTLDIDLGSKVAVIGPNGAGKSTLLLAIGGFIFGQGDICVNGYRCCKAEIKNIRKTLGAVFQDPDDQLFMPRLFDDVAFGPLNMGLSEEQVKSRSYDAIKTVGLEGLENKEPHHLSAGQKRAAAIATILSMMPDIITMDEPDSNLDPRNRNKLIELLNSLKQTIIIASCSMNFVAKVCDKAVLIDDGRLVAAGDAQEIMSNSSLMEEHGLEVPAIYGGS